MLACRGSGEQVAAAIERANARLAEFQRISRWVLWPEPDLPRTSTGKVRRKPVAAWLARIQAAAATVSNGMAHTAAEGAFAPSSDWLLALIAQITGEAHPGVGDELRLTEDLHLDSLGRVQLAAAIEDRLGIVSGSGLLEEVQTLGELRRLVAGSAAAEAGTSPRGPQPQATASNGATIAARANAPSRGHRSTRRFHKSRRARAFSIPCGRGGSRSSGFAWPSLRPSCVRSPGCWPRRASSGPASRFREGPLLIVANHVTDYDGRLVQYALAGPVRRHIAAAMAGEMLEDFRHFRNPEWPPGHKGFYLARAAASTGSSRRSSTSFRCRASATSRRALPTPARPWTTATTCSSFPRGGNRPKAKLARFRPGIGLLAKQCGAPVLPVALRGLGELKTGSRRWFRSGNDRGARGRSHPLRPRRDRGRHHRAPARRSGTAAGRTMNSEQWLVNRE